MKVIFDNKAKFTISTALTTGYAVVYVSRYADTYKTSYSWISQGGVGTQTISVRSTDLNFKIGTYYYITVISTNGKVAGTLRVTQQRDVNYLASGAPTKGRFWTMEEQVKYYYF